ncbi:MAG: sensor histidine kinase [Edaphobacter sp.]|uniref:sensor histidine kinase n=1 Tax=Edaphobacter sp. TaxID=1934404 RepID=UPI00239D41E3|nr:sensor histidine kinase [Edaphobacter sp.]MDE1177933.1 sensor histidine kinase [Edaphobacter sp.]
MTKRGNLIWISLSVLLMTVSIFLAVGITKLRRQVLPYHDSFTSEKAQEWTPVGGFWRLQNGAVINGSDAAGSKLITGFSNWSDYQMTATLRLLAHGGDVGLILRVSNPEVGPNAYRGYYVGLRSNDASLVMGRANYSWLESRPVFMGEPVLTGRWYRLHVVAFRCKLAAEAVDLVTGMHQYAALQDPPNTCITHGQAGLRSTDTGSAWKDISIAKATQADLDRILAHGPALSEPAYPIREQDLNRMRNIFSPPGYPFLAQQEDSRSISKEELDRTDSVPLTTVLDARTSPRTDSRVRLHGVITSISPFYIQDATGGIRLMPPDPGALCIGDEVDAIGQPAEQAGVPVFLADSVDGPRDRTALSTLSITPAQAASGMFEGTLVEVIGQLVSRTVQPNGSVVLSLHADGQDFDALVQNAPFGSRRSKLQSGSTLRLRGISTIAASSSFNSSFTILVQSAADIDVLSGPSWLAGWRLFCLAAAGLLASGAAVYIVMHSSRSRAADITAERERLSHQVHDTLAQSFAGISYRLQGLRKHARGNNVPKERLVEELDEIYQVVAGTHREASAFIAALHPTGHENSDLLSLIERASINLCANHGPSIHTSRSGEPCILDPALADVLFRVALEGMANVLRHAQASTVRLALDYTQDAVTLTLEDDGIGFSPDSVTPHLGLQAMQKRCAAVKASLHIDSTPGRGTCLCVTAPHGTLVRTRIRFSPFRISRRPRSEA